MRGCLVFNPHAGSAERIKDFLTHLTGPVRWEVRVVPDEDEARRLGDDVREGAFDRLIVGGGDGTLGLVVRGLAPDFPPVDVALLPFGTGNDFARALGIDVDDMEEAFRRAVSEPGVPVDAVRMETADGETWFVNVANGGMGGKVAQDVGDQDKHRWGSMAYWVASVTALVKPPSYEVRLTLDDETEEVELCGLAIANGRYFGGGFPMARHAWLDDGLLDVTMVPVLPRLELVSAGIDFALERDAGDNRLVTRHARKVRVASEPEMPFSVDGEPARAFDATFEVLPRVLRFVPGGGERALGGDE